MDSFLFVTKDVEFQETDPEEKFIRIKATFLELDKPSIGSISKIPKIYRFEEATKIADSLIGKPVYYGTNWAGAHTDKHEIGFVETAKKIGKRIKGTVKVWITEGTSAIIESLKSGSKFLFSVGGVAQFGKLIKKGGQHIQKLYNALCTHLQMVPSGTKVGFPNAKLEKIVEIQETVMVCEDDVCSILGDIKEYYGESCGVCQSSKEGAPYEYPKTLISGEDMNMVEEQIIRAIKNVGQNKQN